MKRTLMALAVVLLFCGIAHASITISGDIDTDTTFLQSNNPHQISGTVRVLNGVTLTIQPGVTLLFENGSSLQIEGQLSAVGTSEFPIVFTTTGDSDRNNTRVFFYGAEGSTLNHCSLGRSSHGEALLSIVNSSPVHILNCSIGTSTAGHGIYIVNSTVNINYTGIANVAQRGIFINDNASVVNLFDVSVDGCQTGIYTSYYPTLVMDDISLQHCSSFPIYASLINYANLGSLQVSYCPVEMLAIHDTNINASITLPYQDEPYCLTSNLTVSNWSTLSLEAGVDIMFRQYARLSFNNGSSLYAVGTQLLPITFTPALDNASNQWGSLVFDVGCSATLDHCVFQGCGFPQYGYPEPSIQGTGIASLSISNSSIPGGGTYGIYISGSHNGALTLNNVSIEDCPWTGLYILDRTITFNYSDLSISGCGRPLAIPANLIDFIDEQPLFTANTDNRIFIHNDGYMYRNTTIRNWGYPWVCEALDINTNYSTLTIEAGSLIQMGYSCGFVCSGAVSVNGTAEDPVTITRLPDSTNNWRGFIFDGDITAHVNHAILEHCASSNNYSHVQEAFQMNRANSVLIENTQIIDAVCRAIFIYQNNADADSITIRNVSISGCGMDAVYQNSSGYKLAIDGLSISGCSAYPISISSAWIHRVQNLTLSGNAHNVIRLLYGNLASQTLTNFGYPYQIQSTLTVYYTNVVLQPGTVFYFEDGIGVEVYGTLTAHGTAAQPIVFDRVPGSSYYWKSVYLRNNSSASFQHCMFANGGKASEYGQDDALIDNIGASSLSIQNCAFTSTQAQVLSFTEIGTGDTAALFSITIDGCGTDAFWCNDADLALTAVGITISNAGRYPVSIPAQLAGCFQDLLLESNTNNFIRIFSSGYMYNSVSFPNHGYPYAVETGLVGNQGSSISFAPGCQLWIANNQLVDFYGAVQAVGTGALPIIFTRYPQNEGNWQGIRIYNASWDADFVHCQILYAGAQETYGGRRAFSDWGCSDLNIAHCLIRYSTGDGFVSGEMASTDVITIDDLHIRDVPWTGFYCNDAYHPFTVNNLTLQDVGGYPLQSASNLLDCFSNLTIINPGNPHIRVTNTQQSRTATWPNLGLPYYFSNGFTVNSYETLTIPAGCTLVFADYVPYSAAPDFTVYGSLNTLGTLAEPVLFRGVDPLAPSTWLGLRFKYPGGTSNLSYTTIQNAGLDQGDNPYEDFSAVYVERGTVNFSDCTIRLGMHNLLKQEAPGTINLLRCTLQGGNNGIVHQGGSLSLINSEITSCSANGIYHNGGSVTFGNAASGWNKIHANSTNFYNNSMSVIDAPYVYWGTTGASAVDALLYDNEEGKGQVNFEPWYDATCQNLYYLSIDTPTGVNVILQGASTIRLAWNAVPAANSYKVLWASEPDAITWTLLQEDIHATYLDVVLAPDQAQVFYKVVAVQ